MFPFPKKAPKSGKLAEGWRPGRLRFKRGRLQGLWVYLDWDTNLSTAEWRDIPTVADDANDWLECESDE